MHALTKTGLIVLGGLLAAGCAIERREKDARLTRAEAQQRAIGRLSGVPPAAEQHAPAAQAAGAFYEYGIVIPPSCGVALGLGLPLFGLDEALQVVATTLFWWSGAQDRLNDAAVALYERGASWERIHDLFPEAPGGMSYTRLHTPSAPASKRGDQP